MARKRTLGIRQPELTDEEWALLSPHLPEPQASARGGPKPVPNRPVVEGILWILRNGARWKALPEGYPAPATCWRRLSKWEADGTWLAAWRAFLGALDDRMALRWDECCADGSFAPAKKGATASAPPRRARGPRGCSSSTATGSRWSATLPTIDLRQRERPAEYRYPAGLSRVRAELSTRKVRRERISADLARR